MHVRSDEVNHVKLDWSKLDHAEPNEGLHHQIMCKHKRIQNMTDTVFFFGTSSII